MFNVQEAAWAKTGTNRIHKVKMHSMHAGRLANKNLLCKGLEHKDSNGP